VTKRGKTYANHSTSTVLIGRKEIACVDDSGATLAMSGRNPVGGGGGRGRN